jgi:hypothetical protein
LGASGLIVRAGSVFLTMPGSRAFAVESGSGLMTGSVVVDGPVPGNGVAGVISGFAWASIGISIDRSTATSCRVRKDPRMAVSLVARW